MAIVEITKIMQLSSVKMNRRIKEYGVFMFMCIIKHIIIIKPNTPDVVVE
jgi:hypothetical protein